MQLETETVGSLITALYALAQNCDYGLLHDELILDRLVVGPRDMVLSEKMQLDKSPTLQKAVTMARQPKAVKRQQSDSSMDAQSAKSTMEVDDVTFKIKNKSSKIKIHMNRPNIGARGKTRSARSIGIP